MKLRQRPKQMLKKQPERKLKKRPELKLKLKKMPGSKKRQE